MKELADSMLTTRRSVNGIVSPDLFKPFQPVKIAPVLKLKQFNFVDEDLTKRIRAITGAVEEEFFGPPWEPAEYAPRVPSGFSVSGILRTSRTPLEGYDPAKIIANVLSSGPLAQTYSAVRAGVAKPLVSEHAARQLRQDFIEGISGQDLKHMAMTPPREQELTASFEEVDLLSDPVRAFFWHRLLNAARWAEEDLNDWLQAIDDRARRILVDRLVELMSLLPVIMFLEAGLMAWVLGHLFVGAFRTRDGHEYPVGSPDFIALSRPCKFCGAEPGDWCVKRRGPNVGDPADRPHKSRLQRQ